MKNFLKRFILNFIMSIVALMLPALAITVSVSLVAIPQLVNHCSDKELFLVCVCVSFYMIIVFALLITIFQKIDVLENKIKKFLNIYE